MKKWLGILGILVILAGCEESTTDVATHAVRPMVAEPDTILAFDSLNVEVYLPDNPGALAAGARLQGNQGVRLAQERLAGEGYSNADGDLFFMRATTLDGRVLEATWFANLDSPDGRAAMIGHIRLDGRQFVVPIRGGAVDDPARPEFDVWTQSKNGDWRPNTVFNFGACGNFAMGLFYACLVECMRHDVTSKTCKYSCAAAAGAAWVTCILFTAVGE